METQIFSACKNIIFKKSSKQRKANKICMSTSLVTQTNEKRKEWKTQIRVRFQTLIGRRICKLRTGRKKPSPTHTRTASSGWLVLLLDWRRWRTDIPVTAPRHLFLFDACFLIFSLVFFSLLLFVCLGLLLACCVLFCFLLLQSVVPF
jgi:hypothetical protein